MKTIKFTILALCICLLAGCKVGGTVKGLKGKLELTEINSGESLIITENGPFFFEHEFEEGDKYYVEITQQPIEPSQTCRIENNEGVVKERPIRDIMIKCEDDEIMCPAVYMPVCAIVTEPIVCVTSPCIPPKHYKTFANSCAAEAAGAEVVLYDECGRLEGQPVDSIAMVPFATTLFDRGDRITINETPTIKNHLLTVNVSYSGGCARHDFNLFGDTAFNRTPIITPIEPTPIPFPDPLNPNDNASITFIEPIKEGGAYIKVSDSVMLFHNDNDDMCDAFITENIVFDLTPLRNAFQRTFNRKHGEVELQITAPASIPEGSKAPLRMYSVIYIF